MITVTNLSKKYSGQTVLEILDLIEASTGNVTFNKIDVHKSEEWKPYTSAFIDESYLISYLTVEEYFYFLGNLRAVSNEEINIWVQEFEPFFNGEILGQKKYLRDLSKGNQKKAGIVGTLIGKPELVILDEPFANLDPTTQIRLKKLIRDEAEKHGTTFLISSHDLIHVIEVCDRIVLLEKGLAIKDI
jgi:ABC-2 type transport system ATP-binding protein